jgi:predicted dithiol-disulfide oxidoreductase (DUF899 family)
VSTGQDDADRRGDSMAEHQIGTRDEWQAARDELLAMDKELTQRNEAVERQRAALVA